MASFVRFNMIVMRKDTHDVAFDVNYYVNNIPQDALDFCKHLLNVYHDFTDEIWLYDNEIDNHVAKVYRNADNRIYVKCYATL